MPFVYGTLLWHNEADLIARLMMSVVRFLSLAVCVAAAFCCADADCFGAAPDKQTAARKPNILYIFTDDQTPRTISCYPEAHPWAKTPNIDKLAQSGIRFTHCYTGAICVPSRANALTGRLQTGCTKQTPYWTEHLRKQGYYTGMVGKWHWHVPQHGTAWDWSVVWEHYLPENLTNYYVNQPVRIHGDKLVDLGGYSTDRYTDYTIEFLNERAKEPDKPWYFWVCYGAVHSPYTPAERHKQDYADAPETEIPVDIFGPRPDKPENMINVSMWSKNKHGKPVRGKRSLDACVKQYNQAVRAIDENVGRIMKALQDNGQAENTIVFFTSDQGYAWGQHGLMGKIAPYDANINAPLIVASPTRFPQGKVCRHPVSGPDIIRTFHSLAGMEPAIELHGRDFSALLVSPETDTWTTEPMLQACTGSLYGEEAIANALAQAKKAGNWNRFVLYDKSQTKAWLMLREGKYKYVRYICADYIEELYDLEADPGELRNLAVKQEHHGLLARLRQKTCEQFRARGAKFIDDLPPPKIVSKVPYIQAQEDNTKGG